MPSTDVSAWPLILCGPMLRRVTADSVTVWLALKSPRFVTLRVYPVTSSFVGDGTQGSGRPTPIMIAGRDTIQLGDNLHVACITAKTFPGDTKLQPGLLYCYDLELTPANVPGTDEYSNNLSANGLLANSGSGLSERLALGYTAGWLPRFALPPDDLTQLRIFHGSCRKPHGAGVDALATLDRIIEETLSQPLAQQGIHRPQQLFLTGDQIYADDVAAVLLHELTAVGSVLLGWEEKLPGINRTVSPVGKYASPLVPNPEYGKIDVGLLPTQRASLVNGAAKFTTKHGTSHLLTLGEYYAMYLFVWSQELWPPTLPGTAEVLGHDPDVSAQATAFRLAHSPMTASDYRGFLKEANKDLQSDQKHNLQTFRLSLPRVRRVLANVPSYMMCDDHEVTDDWYLNGEVTKDVLSAGNLLARRILTNALAAFSVFQAWGNTPELFDGGPGKNLLDALNAWQQSKGNNAVEMQKLASALGIVDWGAPQPGRNQRLVFDFGLSWSKHRVVVLDTRTWRFFPSLRGRTELIGAQSLADQLAAANDGASVEVTFIVSPGPVLGVPLVDLVVKEGVERILQGALALSNFVPATHFYLRPLAQEALSKWPYTADLEAWEHSYAGHQRLLRSMRRWPRVVILSGDVHYGFSIRCEFWEEGTGGLPAGSAVFVQLTSSPLKNEDDWTPELHKRGYDVIRPLPSEPVWVLGWRNGWESTDPPSLARKVEYAPSDPAKYLPRGNLAETRLEVECNPCTEAPAVAVLRSYLTVNQEPDWLYHLEFLTEARTTVPDRSIWTPSPIPGHPASLDRDDLLGTYRKVAGSHSGYLHKGVGRELVRYNNIGEVTFAAEPKVIHRLWWLLPDQQPTQKPAPLTQHEGSLAPPNSASKPSIHLG